MFSSTTVASPASRAWITHDTGNIARRMRSPSTPISGIVAIATHASGTLMVSISPNATSAIAHCTTIDGPNARYICTARMSALDRDISSPDCTRS
ncbi:hypothetical protein JCM9534A_67630 [Catenuloplanes indicus JCM 9534]